MTTPARSASAVRGLLLACHPIPTVAVTVFALVLAATISELPTTALVTGAVLAGQLAIGWHNDLLDAARDRAAGRTDKPVARGLVCAGTVRGALGVAVALTILLTFSGGGWAGLALHVGLVVGSGLAYNAGLKATAWSWLPYAVAFGALPGYVWAAAGLGLAPWWVLTVGALLGVGAHLLNVLPDMHDDLRLGVRGFPHRIGRRATRTLAPLLLLTGSFLLYFAPAGSPRGWVWPVAAGSVALAVVAWTGQGKAPFLAAIGIALLNVIVLAAIS